MKTKPVLLSILGLCISTTGAKAAEAEKEKSREEAKAETLFNGKDLAGWEGDPKLWSVRDGMIVGKTTDEDPLPYNRFLIWRGGEPENFVLTAKIRVIGDNNSGIQYRSKELPEAGEHVVGGYQCDIHPSPEYHGMLYEEKGRGITAKRGMEVVVTPEGEMMKVDDVGEGAKFEWGEWHTYLIRAIGNRLVHQVDGETTVKIIDHEKEARSLGGLIAFQVHRGNAMEVHIKEVRLRPLPPGGIVPPEQTPVPEGATPVNPPKPKKKEEKRERRIPE